MWMWQLQDFDACIAHNEEAIRLDPTLAECYGNLANALKVQRQIVTSPRQTPSKLALQFASSY